MADNINKIAQNVDGNEQCAQTAASLAHLTDHDVVKIWDAVSSHIETFMRQSKGVIISGFGTFSFIQKRIDVGNNKHLLIQRPVFVLAEKVAQNHGLKSTRYPVNGSVPVHPLNYFSIQTQSNYTRDQIEQCVKHVLQVFNRSVAARRNVEFTFSRIGKLLIRDGKVKMRFFKDFVHAVDETASKQLVENMCNRPQTSDSVMSEREAGRPPTASNVVLPRINSRVGNPSMQAIQEENQLDDESLQPTDEILSSMTLMYSPIEEKPTTSAHVVKTTGPGMQNENIVPIASLFSSMDFMQPPIATSRRPSTTSGIPMRRSFSFHQHEPAPTAPIKNIFSNASLASFEQPAASCEHHGIGQELCHPCHERAKRNIPVYLHEERRMREAEEAKLLEQYRHDRDLDERRKQEAAMKATREERQRMAAFNLGVAEARRAKKLERPQTTDVPRSIIFRKRIQTPPSYIRRHDLAKQLEAQIKWRKDEQRAERNDKDFSERLEQIQLAESLAQEREVYFRNKRLHQAELKSALDNQVRNKPSALPAGEPSMPYFGLNDMSTEKLLERRLHAVDISRQQKDVVEQRERQHLLEQIRDQEYESTVLERIKEDLKSDGRERHRRALRIRKDLENDWTNASGAKQERDGDERAYIAAPQGILVHEQCDQYKRCAQCQRNLNNLGTSNLWSGTHIMV